MEVEVPKAHKKKNMILKNAVKSPKTSTSMNMNTLVDLASLKKEIHLNHNSKLTIDKPWLTRSSSGPLGHAGKPVFSSVTHSAPWGSASQAALQVLICHLSTSSEK